MRSSVRKPNKHGNQKLSCLKKWTFQIERIIVNWELNDFSISFLFSRTQNFSEISKKNSEISKYFCELNFFLKFTFLLDAASDRTSVTAHLKIGILAFQ